MIGQLQFNYATISRAFVIIAGLVKVGYVLMMLQCVYYTIIDFQGSGLKNLYFKYIATFVGGNIVTALLYFKISRFLVIALSEVIFIIVMVVTSFASIDITIYGFLVAGGIGFLVYPLYAREFFLRSDLPKLFIFIWAAIGVGICYYFGMDNKNLDYFEGELIKRDNTSPYLFGSLSIINLILLISQKQRETILFYSFKDSVNQNLENLISLIYQPQHHSKKLEEFMGNRYQNERNIPLLDSSTSLDVQNQKINQKQFYILCVTALAAGASSIFNQNLINFQSYLLLITSGDYISDISNAQYYSYLIILITTTALGCIQLIIKTKRILATIGSMITLVLVIFSIILTEQQSENSQLQNFVAVVQFCFQFSFVASMIFFIPFYLLKEHKVVLYFFLLWIGSVLNKLFINNAYQFEDYQLTKNYNSQIIVAVSLFIGSISIFLVKSI